ncbi:MAG TPA: hypothetical protein VMF13_08030 [Luteitalea sp.]|nr:hypothetical protein [Luteitalea sp.]
MSTPPRNSCAYPLMAFSGVRSSCESTARNSSFIAVGVARFDEESSILERNGGPTCDAGGQPFVFFREDAW